MVTLVLFLTRLLLALGGLPKEPEKTLRREDGKKYSDGEDRGP